MTMTKENRKEKLKYCCAIFAFLLGILLWLWYLKSLSTPMCPWQIFGQTVEKLDVPTYSGTWYQMMVNKDVPFGGNSKCVRAIYSDNPLPRRVTVTNTGLSGDKPNQKVGGIKGYAE